MANRMDNENIDWNQYLQQLQAEGTFELSPYDENTDLDNNPKFTKLELGASQKVSVGSLIQSLPFAAATTMMSQTYVVRFPAGMPHTLLKLKQGGYGTPIQGENGRFVGSASLYKATTRAAIFGAFTAMSVASGQYFLSRIDNDLSMMKMSLDKILEFLYGDKKAELLAEVNFAKYAYENYSSIMSHEDQRVATIISLQKAKKVAMKDIEFYLVDLESAVDARNNSDVKTMIDKAFQIKESLELSMQLYAFGNILEVYYAQNHDEDYISYIETDVSTYIDKCEKRILSSFAALNVQLQGVKAKVFGKINGNDKIKKKIIGIIESLGRGEKSDIQKSLHDVLHISEQKSEYYISGNGNVYYKTIT